MRSPGAVLALALLCTVPAQGQQANGEAEYSRWAVTAFTGRMTENVWFGIPTLPEIVAFSDVRLFGLAASCRLARLANGMEFEVEGHVAKYKGAQDNWEVNLPLVARWNRFPWSGRLRTSAAFGLGLSWAASTPDYEITKGNGSEQLLAYWMVDLDAGPKGSPWSVVARLHHRSVAFGVFGESGGANTMVLGLRYRFGHPR